MGQRFFRQSRHYTQAACGGSSCRGRGQYWPYWNKEKRPKDKLSSSLITTPKIGYNNMPVVLSIIKFQFSMIQTFQSKGISDVATEMAAQPDLPFAGRITQFLSNWEAITQDSWVLQTIQGFRIEWTQTKPQALPDNLHTKGGGLHAGRNHRHD